MEKNYRSHLTGVFGYPVDENPTIVMQEAAFKALGIDWRYLTLKVEPENLADAFAGLKAMNFDGINLTVPHKIEGMKYMDEIDLSAKIIGAVNTVVVKDGKLIGYNTDGQGLVQGMKEAGVDLVGKKIVVLGAGGASRAVCVECALAGVSEMVIMNRTAEKAEQIAKIICDNTDCKATACGWESGARIPKCDILINATSIGLYPDPGCPDICYDDITEDMIVQDIIPNPAYTLFLKKAEEKGARVLDGLGMLVNQGAIGFKLWTGEEAPVEAMKVALEKENEVL